MSTFNIKLKHKRSTIVFLRLNNITVFNFEVEGEIIEIPKIDIINKLRNEIKAIRHWKDSNTDEIDILVKGNWSGSLNRLCSVPATVEILEYITKHSKVNVNCLIEDQHDIDYILNIILKDIPAIIYM